MSDTGSEPVEHTGVALLLWNTARRRRGYTREDFDAEMKRARGDRYAMQEFQRRIGMFDGPDVPMHRPEDYDQPDDVLGYGSPGHVLDEHGSVDGCHWND